MHLPAADARRPLQRPVRMTHRIPRIAREAVPMLERRRRSIRSRGVGTDPLRLGDLAGQGQQGCKRDNREEEAG